MNTAMSYEELCRLMMNVADVTDPDDDLGEITREIKSEFRKDFKEIRRDLGKTFADILARESEVGRRRIHDAINTAISWKLWLREPLAPIEAAFQGAYALQLEVNNGGFHQFFFNSSGKYWPQILWVMGEAGDSEGVQRFTEILSVFPNGQPSVSRQERWLQMKTLESEPATKKKVRAHFKSHDKLFQKNPFPDNELYWQLLRQRLPAITITWIEA